MGFMCGVTEIHWNLQPEKFQLREASKEVCKAVTGRSKSGKTSTVSYNARIMCVKRGFLKKQEGFHLCTTRI